MSLINNFKTKSDPSVKEIVELFPRNLFRTLLQERKWTSTNKNLIMTNNDRGDCIPAVLFKNRGDKTKCSLLVMKS